MPKLGGFTLSNAAIGRSKLSLQSAPLQCTASWLRPTGPRYSCCCCCCCCCCLSLITFSLYLCACLN